MRLDSCDAGLPGGFCHGFRHGGADSGVEGGGDDIVLVQLLVGDQIRQRVGGGDLHFLVDVAGANVKSAAENAGEGQHVVDLVGIVAAAGGNHSRAACFGLVRENQR